MSYLVINSLPLNWKFTKNSPRKFQLSSLKGYSLLNPCRFSTAYENLGLLSSCILLPNDAYYSITRGLLIEQPEGQDLQSETNSLFKYLSSFFKYLRFESLHSEIKPNNYISSIMTVKQVDANKSTIKKVSGLGIYAPIYNTLITFKNIKDADKKLSLQIKLPVAEEILIDAFDSLKEHQYDKTILFSAIAIEALLANYFDQLHENIIARKLKNKNLRIVRDNKGNYKDPIFKALIDRNDFKKLLNEIPLYLINKSIYLEEERLFHQLIKLHNTRNKIVHWGAPIDENEDERIPLNLKGANMAFDIALDTFHWLGVTRFEVLRNRKHILIGGT